MSRLFRSSVVWWFATYWPTGALALLGGCEPASAQAAAAGAGWMGVCAALLVWMVRTAQEASDRAGSSRMTRRSPWRRAINEWSRSDCVCNEIDPADRPCLVCEARSLVRTGQGSYVRDWPDRDN